MDKIDNAIDSAYRALAENLSKDNILLYSEVPDPKLQIVFSTLHTTILNQSVFTQSAVKSSFTHAALLQNFFKRRLLLFP